MSTENTADYKKALASPPDPKRYRTFEDLEVYQVARSGAEIEALKRQGWRVHQLINGYIRWLRERKQGATLELREESPAYGLTEDQLDELLADAGALPLLPFNDSTL